MLIAIASTRGAPGVTTTALLMARLAAEAGWNATVIEADADGAVLPHLFPGLEPEPTLLDFAVAARRDPDPDLLDKHSQRIDADTTATAVVAPPLGKELARALKVGVEQVVAAAHKPGRMLVVDCGRISNAGAELFEKADRKFLLATPEAHVALGLRDLYGAHPDEVADISTLLVGDKPYGPEDLATIGIDVAGVLPDDPRTADMVLGRVELNLKRLVKTGLYRSVGKFVPSLADDPYVDVEVDAPPAPADASMPPPDAPVPPADAPVPPADAPVPADDGEWSPDEFVLPDEDDTAADEPADDTGGDTTEPAFATYELGDEDEGDVAAGDNGQPDDDTDDSAEADDADDDLDDLLREVTKDAPDPAPDWSVQAD
jgi:hypothetical protein